MTATPSNSQATLINLSFLAAVSAQNPDLLPLMNLWMEKLGPEIGMNHGDIQGAKDLLFQIRRMTNVKSV